MGYEWDVNGIYHQQSNMATGNPSKRMVFFGWKIIYCNIKNVTFYVA